MEYLINGAKLIIGFLAFMVVLRLLGKKHFAEMTPYDIIYLLMFGGILEETLYDTKITIPMFLFSLFVWAVAIYLVEAIVVRSNLLRIWMKGSPDKIIADGKVNKHLLEKTSWRWNSCGRCFVSRASFRCVKSGTYLLSRAAILPSTNMPNTNL